MVEARRLSVTAARAHNRRAAAKGDVAEVFFRMSGRMLGERIISVRLSRFSGVLSFGTFFLFSYGGAFVLAVLFFKIFFIKKEFSS